MPGDGARTSESGPGAAPLQRGRGAWKNAHRRGVATPARQFKESGISACGILIAGPDSRRRTRLTLLSQYVTAFPFDLRALAACLRRRNRPAMLPGIRFLLAAILLSISIVVFGLGAAALLRAAHEDFA